jgi:hypothetical protein
MAVTLEGRPTCVVIAVVSNPEGRGAIARALFQLDAGQKPEPRDEADAVGELTNVIAGRIKVALAEFAFRLSVPSALATEGAAPTQQVALRISFGSVPAALVIALRPA